jgi:hypothetical protein
MEQIKAPGLRWIARNGRAPAPYWAARPAAIAAGYPVKTANLSSLPPEQIAARCADLEARMLEWLGGSSRASFDGTLGSLLRLYQTHEDSPYRALKPSSSRSYTHYLGRLIRAYGDVRLDRLTGLDVKRWHKTWLGVDNRVGTATMALAVLKSALSFGMTSGAPHCERLRASLGVLRLARPRPRTLAPTAADVERLIVAAHAMGRHGAAFAYALQFETTARQWDIIGEWVPMSDPRPSATTFRGQKWIGPTWAAIDSQLILTLTPTKTERSTGAMIHVNLARCPMVMVELTGVPQEARTGPLVVNEETGRPYQRHPWEAVWRAAREAARLSSELWNRDLRAGGITEAEMAGVSADDRAKLAGHSAKINRAVYSRDRLTASNRVVEARDRFRRGK